MSQVERFFHLRTFGTTGGATVRVTGDRERIGQVDVQVAFCHSGPVQSKRNPNGKGDVYCRKTGRDAARNAPIKIVPLRYLPKELHRLQSEVYKRAYGRSASTLPAIDRSYSVIYFLPKE